MILRITINLDNDAFVGTPGAEAKRIMLQVIGYWGEGAGIQEGKIQDINGKTVGEVEIICEGD